jgi:hypothetical protein
VRDAEGDRAVERHRLHAGHGGSGAAGAGRVVVEEELELG